MNPAGLLAPPQAGIHLACRGLGIRFGDRELLRNLDLDLRAGEVLAVTGPSGCGKSTLVRILAGIQRSRHGTVAVPGDRHGAIAIAFQDAGLPGSLTGLQAICSGRLHTLPWWRGWKNLPADHDGRAVRRAQDLGVDHLLHRTVATASGGERQRLAIARALHHGGRIILLDEPVSQLDPDCARQVMEVLRAEVAHGNRSVLAVVHQPDLVASHADRELAFGTDGAWDLRCIR